MDSNKLIAEFMDLETPDGVYYEYLTKDGHRSELTHFILLEYHLRWDWLMRVVEKIENLGYWVNRNDGDVTISNESDIIVNTPMSSGAIDMMYKSVVEFIKQHNTECDTCKGKGWIDTYNTNTNTQEIQRCDECKVFASDKRKVLITQREVYHKIAKVEIEIPLNVKNDDVADYLNENEELWVSVVDDILDASDYQGGFGLGDGMDEKDQDIECRYDIVNENYGGHI